MISPTSSWHELSSGLAAEHPWMEPLSPAERLVAVHLRQGLSNQKIATMLGKSLPTVKHQVSSILRKLDVTTRSRLIARLHQPG